MRNWDFAFTGSWPAAAVFAAGVAAGILAWFFYRRKRAQLRPIPYAVLLGLRLVAIAGLAAFLMKPVLRFSRDKLEKQNVIVLQDVSLSMSIRDALEDKSRLEAGRILMRDAPYDLQRKLSENFSVRRFDFGASVIETASDAAEPTQKATAIGDALKDSVTRVGRDGIAAVVLLSDGVSTAGEDPRKICRNLGVPIYAVALGGKMAERGRFHDVGLSGAPHNLELIVNDRAVLRLKTSNFGLEGFSDADRQITLSLRKGGETLAAKPVSFPRENGTREVEVDFVPRELGIYTLTAELPSLAGESVTQNNRRDFTVRVIDPKMRTLIVEGVARSEYRFLRAVLASDPSVDLTSVVKLRKDMFLLQGAEPGVDLSRGLPARAEDYRRFEVVLLGDMAREEFGEEQIAALKQFVFDGGGLLVTGGHRALGAGGWAGSPLEDLLPVRIGAADGQVDTRFAPRMTASGRAHPVMEGCTRFFDDGPGQAMLDGATRVRGAKPGADVLLIHPDQRAGDEPLPVLIAQRYGKGRVLAITADTTWKWKFQVESQGMDSPYYRFWRQSVRWLAGLEDSARASRDLLSAWPVKIEFDPDEPVLIEARVRDAEGQPSEDADVEVAVTYPAPLAARTGAQAEPGATVRCERVPLSQGRYQASFRPRMGGIHHAVVKATGKQGPIAQVEFDFIVGRVAGEFDAVDIDEITLRALARETGGQYHTLADATRIPDELEKRQRRIVYHEERNLWNAPAFFFAFLGCVTLEWVLRKRFALS